MRTIKARKILNVQKEELFKNIKGSKIPVTFDDKTIIMSATQLIASSYFWFCNENDEGFPLLSHYVLPPEYGKGLFNKLFNVVMWDYYDYRKSINNPVDVYDIAKKVMENNNAIYNSICLNMSRHYKSLDILDFMDAAYNDKMIDVRIKCQEETEKDPKTEQFNVNEAFKEAGKILRNGLKSDLYPGLGNISWLISKNAIKENQTLQSILMRGFIADIDRETIPYCITNNLMEGMNTVPDAGILSREGALSLSSNTSELGKITHIGRQVTFSALYKTRIVDGDCGTTKFILYPIKEGEIETLYGVNYITDDGSIKQIKPGDKHLEGTVIKRRTVFFCIEKNPHHNCSTCFGGLSDSFPKNQNIGAILSKYFSQRGVQLTMSVKHHLETIVDVFHKLPFNAKRYLRLEGGAIYLDKAIVKMGVILSIDQRELRCLSTLQSVEDIRSLSIGRVSSITTINIKCKKNPNMFKDITINDGPHNSLSSYELLSYLKEKTNLIEYNPNGSLQIDLDEWDINDPLFIIPPKTTGLLSFYDQLVRIISRSSEKLEKEMGFTHVEHTSDVVHTKLLKESPTNIAMTELLISSYLSYVDNDGITTRMSNYRPDGKTFHSKGNNAISTRSMAVKLSHQQQHDEFVKPSAYLVKDRTDSFLDVLIDPTGVLKGR